jgi:redox-sensitive bicupin YhaK (pirin superfamily)
VETGAVRAGYHPYTGNSKQTPDSSMSVETVSAPSSADKAGPCRAIQRLLRPKEHDLGGFSVRRALPSAEQRMVGPWIFFDHMGPAEFEPGQGIDVRPHPHINLATVTYLFEGEMLHRDSLGNALAIRPGAVNLMVAGRGIVHSERQREQVKAGGNRLEGLQLWLALPQADEETEPAFHHYPADQIPQVDIDGVPVRVLIGEAYGVCSPVRRFAKTLYVEAALNKGQQLWLPDGVAERALYVVSGGLTVMDSRLEAHRMAVFGPEPGIVVKAEQESRIALIGGDPVGPRHIWWNFVSSRKARIEQAKQDWRAGAFAKVPGDEEEFIPLPED